MKKVKVLNLYAGIGGNRKLWTDVEVTAVEINPEIAKIYQDNFPNDKVIVGDAKEYLLKHFKEFEFIWASPPCPSHSRMRTLWKGDGILNNKISGSSYKLPDMDLYSIIIFLQHFYNGNWVVENVISYYNPLIRPYEIDNHYFWSNKVLTKVKKESRNILEQDIEIKNSKLGFKINTEKGNRFKRDLLNNCVNPKVALHIFNMTFKHKQETLLLNTKPKGENGK